jgi:hypothetical protein
MNDLFSSIEPDHQPAFLPESLPKQFQMSRRSVSPSGGFVLSPELVGYASQGFHL